MGFSKAGSSINKQRIICVGRVLCDSTAGSLCKFIGAANNKGGEGIFIFSTLTVHINLFLAVRRKNRRGGRGLDGSWRNLLFVSFFRGFTEDFDFNRKTNNSFKGFREKIQIFFLYNLFHEFGFNI